MFSNHSSDEELWEGIVTENELAFSLLFERYWKKIYTTVYRHLKEKEICQEITQEIFITLWNKRKELKINSFKNYLNAMAKYRVYKYAKDVRTSHLPYQYDNLEEKYYCTNEGDLNLQNSELLQALNHYLDALPKRCKEIFIMSRLEHFSNDEIAEKLQISKRTVENQLTQALKHLRSLLKYSAFAILYLFLM